MYFFFLIVFSVFEIFVRIISMRCILIKNFLRKKSYFSIVELGNSASDHILLIFLRMKWKNSIFIAILLHWLLVLVADYEVFSEFLDYKISISSVLDIQSSRRDKKFKIISMNTTWCLLNNNRKCLIKTIFSGSVDLLSCNTKQEHLSKKKSRK